jgi:hypothetical protein
LNSKAIQHDFRASPARQAFSGSMHVAYGLMKR